MRDLCYDLVDRRLVLLKRPVRFERRVPVSKVRFWSWNDMSVSAHFDVVFSQVIVKVVDTELAATTASAVSMVSAQL